MPIYLKKFENHTQYEQYINGSGAILPNVSICTTEGDVHYNPYVEQPETRVVAKFNVTDTSNPTKIANKTTGFSSIEIDGVEQPSVTTGYTFSTTGEHTVKYTLAYPTSIGTYAFSNCSGLTSINIPSGVTSIGNNAFQNCSGLTSITIPDGVKSISDSTFGGCNAMTSCTIGSGVTSIGSSAFTNCSSLTSIVIPNSVTTIGSLAFQDCSSLTSITIPDSVTTIGRNTFNNTPWWTTYSADASHHYGNIIYINDVAYKATSTRITSVTFKVNTIGIGGDAFQNCSGLTSINIPSGITSIGDNAFYYCSSLSSITIPDSVTTIGMYAFRYCASLTSITCNTVTAPTIYDYTFQGVHINGTLYVPQGSGGYDTWMSYLNGWTKVEQ